MSWNNKKRPNKHAKIPYAYVASEDDPLVLVPDLEIVALVEEAMDYLDNAHSTRKVAAWLKDKAGKTISHQGIILIWRRQNLDSLRTKELNAAHKKRQPKNKADRELAALKRKRADAKRIQTMVTKKLDDKEKASDSFSDTLDFGVLNQKFEQKEIIFQPNPGPQTEFLAASEREVLFGGAAGGGKS